MKVKNAKKKIENIERIANELIELYNTTPVPAKNSRTFLIHGANMLREYVKEIKFIIDNSTYGIDIDEDI